MFGVLLPQSNMLSLSIHEGASSIQNFTIAAGIVMLIIGIFRVSFRGQPLPLPPGPKGYPIIKNAFDVPPKHAWLKYHEWSKHLGDVLHLSAGGQSIIVLNSARAIYELLEGRSAIYSDRPWTAMTYEVGYQDSPVLTPSGPRHRTFRRLSSEVLGPRQVQEWRPLQEQKVQILVRGLLDSPQSFWAHIRRYTASLLLELSHGQVIQGDDDPFLKVAQEINNDFSELAVPGRYLVDIFPGLRFLPSWVGLASKKRAISARKIVKQGLRWTYRQVENQVANGTARPSFAASLIERNTNPSQEEIYIHQWVSLVTYTAGGDTSLSALTSFFLAMALNPDKQRKAQAEIDRVVGFGNRPTFGHRPNLQYVESLIKEVYRLNPAFPMALPHALNSKTDDEYRGWRIPKGSTVIANTWAVLHDANLYLSPFEFLPERYLEVQSSGEDSLKEPAAHTEAAEMNPDPRKFAFGYGRRSCPGQYLIDDTIFIAVATVLALFDIGPLTSGSVPRYTPYVISQPEAFACTIAPRTKAD